MRRIISHCSEAVNPINVSNNSASNTKRYLSQFLDAIKTYNHHHKINLRPTHPVPLINHYSNNNFHGELSKPSYRYAAVISSNEQGYSLNTDTISYKAIPVVFYNDIYKEKDILSRYFRVDPNELNKRFKPNIDYQMTTEFIDLLHFVTEMRFELTMSNTTNVECLLKQNILNNDDRYYDKYTFLVLDGRETLREYDVDTEKYLNETDYEDLLGWFECNISINDNGFRYCKFEDFKYFRNDNYRVISSYGLGATLIDKHTINMMRMAINYGQKGFENKYKQKFDAIKNNQYGFVY